MSGGRFEFDDGGVYCGEWLDGKAHSYGVCTGPNNEGRFEGFWRNGFELSGTYSWSDKHNYKGEWRGGKIDGLGIEDCPSWTYYGEWKNGLRHGSGVLVNKKTRSRYEGTWMYGLQEGYGGEILHDGAYYMGQWKRGFRHGYGIKVSGNAVKMKRIPHRMSLLSPNDLQSVEEKAPLARSTLQVSRDSSLENYDTDRSLSPNPPIKRAYLSSITRNHESRSAESRSAGSRSDSNEISDTMDNEFSPSRLYSQPRRSPIGQDSIRTEMTSHSSGFGTMSESSSNNSLNYSVNSSTSGEIYKGEWLRDRRNVYGISEYIDGSRYIGSWKDNLRDGYGTIVQGGVETSGKWRNDDLLTSIKKKGVNLRSPRMRTKVRISLDGALESGKLAVEKCKTALTRSITARKVAEMAKIAAERAINHASVARDRAEQYDIKLPDPSTELSLSPIERIMGEPTFMAFEISKDLPPRQEVSESRRNSIKSSKKSSAHPAKLAGLFAAMDLTLSAGAVSPLISHALHNRDNLEQDHRNNSKRCRSASLDTAQDALTKLSSSISAFKPGVVGASILLPGFQINTNFKNQKKVKRNEQEPYYYSSAKELELKDRKMNEAASSTASANQSKAVHDDIDGKIFPKSACGSSQDSRSISQVSDTMYEHSRSTWEHSRSTSEHSRSTSEHSRSTSEHSLSTSQTSETISCAISQTSLSSSVVKISGITAMGEPIKLGYVKTTANIDGDNKMIYCTKAPRPRLNHNSSISESKSVSAATGLYRTIIGELPNVLSLQHESDTETSKPSSDVTLQSDDELKGSAILKENTDDEMEVPSNRDLRMIRRQLSLEKLRGEGDEKVNFKESNRQFINHSRTHPSVFRTSSKIRRQKQIDDTDEVFVDTDECTQLHETIRKTKSDISSVHVLKNRRIQIPVRSARSFDTHAHKMDATATKMPAEPLKENQQKVFVSVKSIKLHVPKPRDNDSDDSNSERTNDLLNNNKPFKERSKTSIKNGLDFDDVTAGNPNPSSSNSWICEIRSLSISPNRSCGSDDDTSVRSDDDQSRVRKRQLSQMAHKEPSQFVTWV